MATTDKMNNDVVVLQKDIDQISTVVERLEAAIAKLTDVSSDISRLLAVQDSKIGYHEKTITKLIEDVADHKKEIDTALTQHQMNVIKLETDLEKDMENFHNKIFDEIKSLRSEMNKSNREINDKINKIQTMIYAAIGGGVVIVFIVNQVVKYFTGA